MLSDPGGCSLQVDSVDVVGLARISAGAVANIAGAASGVAAIGVAGDIIASGARLTNDIQTTRLEAKTTSEKVAISFNQQSAPAVKQ